MPIDAEPRPDGNILLRHVNVETPPIAVYQSAEQIAILKREHARRVEKGWQKEPFGLFVSHFGSCPQAESWRKA